MSGAANGANGAAAHASGGAATRGENPRERDPLELLTAWLTRELAKATGKKPERFDLVVRGLRGDLRTVQEWERGEVTTASALASEVFQRAIDEAAFGEPTAKFGLQSQPSGIVCSFGIPWRMESAPADAGAYSPESALAAAINGCRNLEFVTSKFATTLFQGTLEERSLMARVFNEREEATTKRYDKLQGHYEKELDRLRSLVDKLLDERVRYAELTVQLESNAANDAMESRREERRAALREKLYNDALKPILPMIGAKLFAGLKGALPKGDAPPAKADAAKADEVKAEAAKIEAKPVTDEQAQALWNLFGQLEPDDFRKMVEALAPEKRAVLWAVVDVFTGGNSAT